MKVEYRDFSVLQIASLICTGIHLKKLMDNICFLYENILNNYCCVMNF